MLRHWIYMLLAWTFAVDAIPFALAEQSAPVITEECMGARRAAQRYGVHIFDINYDNIIDIKDIGPAAIEFGMHWADTNGDGRLSHKEVAALYKRAVPAWQRLAAWTVSLFTSKYTLEKVFADCDADGNGYITMADYETKHHSTCMETCAKAEDIFDYLGIKFGPIP